jgi:hypothetical protein
MKPLNRGPLEQPDAIAQELPQRFPLLKRPPPESPVDPRVVVFGLSERGVPVTMPETPRFEHAHIIGTTGGGKTNFLEHLIRQDIKKGDGVCVIDPHGNHPDSIHRSLITWLNATGYMRSRKVHLIEPNVSTHTTGFNPLALPSGDTSVSVVAGVTLEAIERVWGDEDTHAKPTIRRLLKATFAALAELRLTLSEAELLFDQSDECGVRAFALATLRDRYARTVLADLDILARTDRSGLRYRDEVVGPLNRLAEFLSAPAIRRIVGQRERVLDLRACMDEGHIILVNLAGGDAVHDADTELLGRLLTRFLFFHAKRRTNRKPFWFVCDECQKYLSGDIPALLAEARKFRVGVVLSHQWQAQLGPADEQTLGAVHNATNLKAAFRVKHPQEAKEIAEMVMPLHLEQPVAALVKPTVVGHRRTLFASDSLAEHDSYTESYGETVGQSVSRTEGESWSTTIGESSARSDAVSVSDSVSENTSDSLSQGSADSWSSSTGSSDAEGWGTSDGQSAGISTTADSGLPIDDLSRVPTIVKSTSGQNVSLSAGATSGQSYSGATTNSRADSTGHTASASRSTGVSNGKSHTVGSTASLTRGQSVARARGGSVAVAHSESHSQSWSSSVMQGTSRSHGTTEGLEPIYADLPSAVHSFENSLYFAATLLRSLPAGQAYMNFVDADGMKAALVRVPRVKQLVVSDHAFEHIRATLLASSIYTLPTPAADASINTRERDLLAACNNGATAVAEPANFRIPIPKRNTRIKGQPDEVN